MHPRIFYVHCENPFAVRGDYISKRLDVAAHFIQAYSREPDRVAWAVIVNR